MRLDVGSTNSQTVRYVDDTYDRIWTPYISQNWTAVSTSLTVNPDGNLLLPSIVMQTAIIPVNGSNSFEFSWKPSDPKSIYYVNLHFAEIEKLQANQTRELNIQQKGGNSFGPLAPIYLSTKTILISTIPMTSGEKDVLITFNKTENSTLPPIRNALEIYRAKEFLKLRTSQQDVDAVMNIKSKYGLQRSDWQGDPCAPKDYRWKGLNCSYNDYNPPRIISLNLSSSGITGDIPSYISSLTSLQVLDLSNNTLTGSVPDFLSQLQSLRVLNLRGNKFIGSVPAGILEKQKNGQLSLRLDGNPDLYIPVAHKNNNNITAPVIATVVTVSVLSTAMAIFLWSSKRRRQETNWWTYLMAIGAALLVPRLSLLCYWIWRKRNTQVTLTNQTKLLHEPSNNVPPLITYGKGITPEKDQGMTNELKLYNFQTIAAATNNFSMANVLGKGGFGSVYKGTLLDGQEIAIKRLSRSSEQGVDQFQNEANLIAKLQHTSLVRLLGCSLYEEERILVYEYLPNRSLDFFIFDFHRKKLLEWKKLFSIIEGIAQGLSYLHKYSRLRVIHRDLKASNILLDDQMNPKISDFGMAIIFGMNESTANTNRIVGTYGYMSPEYAMNGIVSIKTDVYSFGVLVLEIVSGKKNSCYHSEHHLNLVGYAWQLWSEGKALELKEPTLEESCSPDELLRILHVGLLCVQDQATDRPTMSDVVSMLTNETLLLPEPKQPAFYINDTSEVVDISGNKLEIYSTNDVTISVMEAR